jgi:hypothetical protein
LSEEHRYTQARRTCKGCRMKERQKVPRVKEHDRAKTRWTPVRSEELLLCPSKACKAVC